MHCCKKILPVFLLCCIAFLPGCELKKKVDVTLEEGSFGPQDAAVGEVLQVENGSFEPEDVVPVFLGVSAGEAEGYIYPKYNTETNKLYETDGIMMAYTSDYILYTDDNDGAASCYSMICYPSSSWVWNSLGSSLRNAYPEDSLESCTREEVLAACQPYADACGYADADVQVYAMSLEMLQKNSEAKGEISAPGPGFEVVTYGEIAEAENAGEEEKAEAFKNQMYSATKRGISWQKKDEAFLIIYRPYLNGLVVDSFLQRMTLIYAPQYQKVVYAEAYAPFSVLDTGDETKLISKETAVSETMLSLGAESEEDMTVNHIELVYSVRGEELAEDGTVSPCWRIDYDLKKGSEEAMHMDGGTTLINAIDGHVSTY